MSLRLRIVLMYLLLVALSFSAVFWLLIRDIRPRYLQAVEESIVDTAILAAALLAEQSGADGLRTEIVAAAMAAVQQRRFDAQIYHLSKRRVDLRLYVTDERGILIYDSAGLSAAGTDYSRWNDVYLTLQGKYGARSTRAVPDDPASQVLYVAAPILKDGALRGVVSVGKPTNSITFLIAIAQKRFLLGLALIGTTAVVLGIGLSHWITRPVRRLTGYANAIRSGKTKPLPELGTPEIRRLGQALEEMQTRLEGKNYVEDYVRALTHELKSPLTGIRGAAEILRDHLTDNAAAVFLENIETETGRMHNLVDRMLQLSRLENVRHINKNCFRAAAFFDSLAQSFHTRLTARNLQLHIDVPEDLQLEGDEFLLRQAVGNLLANAVDFSPPGGEIALSAEKKGGRPVIRVRDHGPGIPEFAKDKVFEKFFSLSRPESGKKSTGLGLPFVAEVMALHGGSVQVRNLAPGLEAVAVLPGAG